MIDSVAGCHKTDVFFLIPDGFLKEFHLDVCTNKMMQAKVVPLFLKPNDSVSDALVKCALRNSNCELRVSSKVKPVVTERGICSQEMYRFETLSKATAKQAQRVLVESFAEDPLFAQMLPDVERKLQRWLPALFNRGIQSSLKHDCSIVSFSADGEVNGACVCLPPGRSFDLFDFFQGGMLTTVAELLRFGPGHVKQFVAFANEVFRMHEFVMSGRPHYYVFALGDLHKSRRQGLGWKMMAQVTRRADAEGVPCFLESSNPDALSFYRSLGFHVVKNIRCCIDGAGMFLMIREPKRMSGHISLTASSSSSVSSLST
mmetsp:Transcript_13860/g.23801  ORF Transcript_13860/g.23801 Transcript_13860/m.23801 type:complete len:316 (-) Transcript_13860:1189-2136(-)